MIEETGEVTGTEGEYAWVESERRSTCGNCSVRSGCGTSVIARFLGGGRMRLRVLNDIDARVGDSVVIGIPETAMLKGSLAVYAAPLAGLFAGALAGHWLQGDAAAIAGAVIGLGVGLAWLKRFSRRTRDDRLYQPVLLRQRLKTGID